MKRMIGALALAVLFAAACEPSPTGFDPPPASMVILDAAHNDGNQHFFWLPPMVAPASFNGSFDGAQSPEVHIDELGGGSIAVFTTTTGPGSETVRVVPTEEHYVVNWHTDEFPVTTGPTYRITVLLDGTELGVADVELGSTGTEVRNLTTDEVVGLKDGRTLPIKFRIEEGATAPSGPRYPIYGADGSISCSGPVGTKVPRGYLQINGTSGGVSFDLEIRDAAPNTHYSVQFNTSNGTTCDNRSGLGSIVTDAQGNASLTGFYGLNPGTYQLLLSILSGLSGFDRELGNELFPVEITP